MTYRSLTPCADAGVVGNVLADSIIQTEQFLIDQFRRLITRTYYRVFNNFSRSAEIENLIFFHHSSTSPINCSKLPTAVAIAADFSFMMSSNSASVRSDVPSLDLIHVMSRLVLSRAVISS